MRIIPYEMTDEEKIRTTLENGAFPLWVLREYQRKTKKADRAALEYIIERWAMLEPNAEDYGVTLKHFEQKRALANVSSITKKQQAV